MAETAKVSGREIAPSKTEEPGVGAAKIVKHSIEGSSFEVHTASPGPEKDPQKPEGFHGPEPEVSDEKDAHEFADNVADGPKDAVEPEEEELLDEGRDSPDHAAEEGFFSGWDGLDDIHELSAEEEVVNEQELDQEQSEAFEGLGSHHTLSEIALASGSLQTLESDTGPGLSSKHDELAEAVQAALMSVYGDDKSDVSTVRSLPSPDLHAAGPGWASEDNLSPQDVILNYFDYQAASGKSRGNLSDPGDTGYKSDPSNIFTQSQEHPSSRHQHQWPSSPPDYPAYDELPAYPPAAGHAAPPKAAGAADRESSRLLGAAAIGLVGGIAIAASLAVFVINSYGPGGRTVAGAATQTLDTGQPGYGRWIKSNPELETARPAVAASAEAAPVIAASDVMVMSGQPSALAIEVKPEQANERSLISITGIPEGARLNAGVDAGGGNWLLPPRRLTGLTINVPAGTPDTVLMDVQLLDSNVRTPLSDKKQFSMRVNTAKAEPAASPTAPPAAQPQIAAVQRTQAEPVATPETPKPAKPAPPFFSTETVPTPASATTTQAESPAKPATPTGVAQQTTLTRQAALQAPGAPDQPKSASRAEIEDLIREGNKRMKEGDILEARRLYQKAVGLGDPEAALAMGRSYDPVYFARIDRKNAEPDAGKAFDWYRKAMDGGAAQTAKVRIENLKHYLNQ